MKKFLILACCLYACSYAQQLVNSFSTIQDTSVANYTAFVVSSNSNVAGTILLQFAVTNGNAFDIYDYLSGKIATVPLIKQKSLSSSVDLIYVNNSWLSLYHNLDTSGGLYSYKWSFRLYNGTNVILADTFNVQFIFSGGAWYLAGGSGKTCSVWKIGTATAPGTISPLSKKIIETNPEAFIVPSGLKIMTHNYNGTTIVQLFDISGKLVFSDQITNDKIIPSSLLPNSPFVAKINGHSDLNIKVK